MNCAGESLNPKHIISTKDHIGVTAQQLQTVIPEAVIEDGDGYLAVDQAPVVWALVNAVKDLKAENDPLKQRLEALEAKLK